MTSSRAQPTPRGLHLSAVGRFLHVHIRPPREEGCILGDPTVREALLGKGQGPPQGTKDVLLQDTLRSRTQWGSQANLYFCIVGLTHWGIFAK